jgi:hypothetical protein
MFRNQTSNAAQKAEGAWRQRTKARQRESIPGHETSSAELHTSQGASTSSTVNATLLSAVTQPLAIPTSFTSSFDQLSVSSRVNPDLRRLAYERYVYDFVVPESPNKSSGAHSDAMYEYIPKLYQGAPEGSCLVMAVDACAYANLANRCNALEAQALGVECVGKAIQLLQSAITDPERAPTDETVCAVYMLGIYGVWYVNAARWVSSHVLAESRHDRLRTAASPRSWSKGAFAVADEPDQICVLQSDISATIRGKLYKGIVYPSCTPLLIKLQLIQWQQLIASLQSAKVQALPYGNMIAIRKYHPKFFDASGFAIVRLMESEVNVHARWHKIKNDPILPASRSELRTIFNAALDLDTEFQDWESTLPTDWCVQTEPNTVDIRNTYDTRWRNLMLGSRGAPEEIHRYPSLRRCTGWQFYRTSRIFLLRDLLEMLNWMSRLRERHSRSEYAQDISTGGWKGDGCDLLDDLELQQHRTFITAHMVRTIEKSCSAVIGNFTCPIHGKSDEDVSSVRGMILLWSLGIIDSVLKSGLVPDTSLVAPRNDSELSLQTNIDAASNVPAPTSTDLASAQSGHALGSQISDAPHLQPTTAVGPQPSNASSTSSVRSTQTPTPRGHIFDSGPHHHFDDPTGLPPLDPDFGKPLHMDVAARREWLNRLLYYIGTELGIKRALSVPATEGYMEVCKRQVEALFPPH